MTLECENRHHLDQVVTAFAPWTHQADAWNVSLSEMRAAPSTLASENSRNAPRTHLAKSSPLTFQPSPLFLLAALSRGSTPDDTASTSSGIGAIPNGLRCLVWF